MIRLGAYCLGLCLIATACDDDEHATPSGTSTMTASIAGSAFTADPASGVYDANTGTYGITGVSGNAARVITIYLAGLNGPGTYPLGTAEPYRYASVGIDLGLWDTGLAGGDRGSVTVTTVTANHIVGTFTFTGQPVGGTSATGTKQVGSGAFDVKIP